MCIPLCLILGEDLPLRMITKNFDIDEAADVKLFRSENVHIVVCVRETVDCRLMSSCCNHSGTWIRDLEFCSRASILIIIARSPLLCGR